MKVKGYVCDACGRWRTDLSAKQFICSQCLGIHTAVSAEIIRQTAIAAAVADGQVIPDLHVCEDCSHDREECEINGCYYMQGAHAGSSLVCTNCNAVGEGIHVGNLQGWMQTPEVDFGGTQSKGGEITWCPRCREKFAKQQRAKQRG